jgi:hypothetical protein
VKHGTVEARIASRITLRRAFFCRSAVAQKLLKMADAAGEPAEKERPMKVKSSVKSGYETSVRHYAH